MRGLSAAILLLCATGCAHRVQVSVPAAPAVHLDTTRVAVAVYDPRCRDVAAALITALEDKGGIVVDPRAPVTLELRVCERTLTGEVDIVRTTDEETREIGVVGSAYAFVVVNAGGAPTAELIGAARDRTEGARARDVPAMSRQVDRALVGAVADDLAEQVRPLPRQVARRVWPNAAEGTARRLYSLAVEQERAGNLAEARRLAAMAVGRRPVPLYARYLAELEALIERQGPIAAAGDTR